MTTGRKIKLPGYTVGKDGKAIKRKPKGLDASARVKQAGGRQKVTWGKGRRGGR
jgi:hypothetical protein